MTKKRSVKRELRGRKRVSEMAKLLGCSKYKVRRDFGDWLVGGPSYNSPQYVDCDAMRRNQQTNYSEIQQIRKDLKDYATIVENIQAQLKTLSHDATCWTCGKELKRGGYCSECRRFDTYQGG